MKKFEFRKAERKRSLLRIAIDGPSGSGKTFTALRFAFALAGESGKVAVIDTEKESSEFYQGISPDGREWDFEILGLEECSPAAYIAAIEAAADAKMDVLIIDSLSHAWAGKEGLLEIHGKIADKSHNSWAAWRNVTPMHNRLVDTMLSFPGHVIATMRSKTEWVTEVNDKGKTVPRKIGLAPIQRAGMEYEFTVYGSMDQDHFLTIAKDRSGTLDGAKQHKPSAAFVQPLLRWLEGGKVTPIHRPARRRTASDEQIAEIGQLWDELGIKPETETTNLMRNYSAVHLDELPTERADEYIAKLRRQLEVTAEKEAARKRNEVAKEKRNENAKPKAKEETKKEPQETKDANGQPQAAAGNNKLTEEINAELDVYYTLNDVTLDEEEERDRIQSTVLAKRGVERFEDLNQQQAEELLANLKRKNAELHAASKEKEQDPF